MHDAAVEVQLPAALLRMGITQRKGRVVYIFGMNVRDVRRVTRDAHLVFQARRR